MIAYVCLLLLMKVILLLNPISSLSFNNDTLVLTHVLFRHGDRTPSLNGLWPTNPYYNESFYEPYGYGQLTNKGKMRAYTLGATLRKRYSQFLGDTWNVKVYDAWTTDYDRAKMSVSLVLGGLFPPDSSVLWNTNIPWQAIPYRYLPVDQDKELLSWACPRTVPLIYADDNNMKRLRAYNELIGILKANTGVELDYVSALDLYFGMYMQEELGLPLDNWTKTVYPEPLKSYTMDFYYIETSTKELKTVLAGYFLKKILTDTINKINGTLKPQERKIFLYSAHDVNVATTITALELYNLVDPPPYASYLLIEVHEIHGTYGIKIYYEDYKGKIPHLLTLPGCKAFCPIEDFIRLTSDILPKSDVECFGE